LSDMFFFRSFTVAIPKAVSGGGCP